MTTIDMPRIHGTFGSLEIPHTNFVGVVIAMLGGPGGILAQEYLACRTPDPDAVANKGTGPYEACVRGTS